MNPLLGYIPFLEPMQSLQEYTYLLIIPLAFGISVIYRAVRLPQLDRFWWRASTMTAQIVLAMIGLAIGLAVLIQVVIPRV